MLHIPKNRKINIIPDLDDLPDMIKLPRHRRMPLILLIVSAAILSCSTVGGVYLPESFMGANFITLLVMVFFGLLIASLVGIIALRRWATQDEVTISEDGVKLRKYRWIALKDQFFPWSDFASIRQTPIEGYEVLTLVPKDQKIQEIPVAVSQNYGGVSSARLQLSELMKSGK